MPADREQELVDEGGSDEGGGGLPDKAAGEDGDGNEGEGYRAAPTPRHPPRRKRATSAAAARRPRDGAVFTRGVSGSGVSLPYDTRSARVDDTRRAAATAPGRVEGVHRLLAEFNRRFGQGVATYSDD